MEAFLAIVGIVLIAFIFFCIYFIFKQIQFVLVSVNLYKKMVNRQDAIVKLLLDIRDNTKKYSDTPASSMSIGQDESQGGNSELPAESTVARIEKMKKNIARDPSNGYLYLELGDFYVQHGQRGEALLEYKKALNLRPDWTPAKNRVKQLQSSASTGDKITPEFCYHCGADNPQNAKVCPSCGKPL